MKRFFIIFAVLALVALFMTGCQEKEEVTQTEEPAAQTATADKVVYHAEAGPDDHGWVTVVDFTKVGDDVTEATFDALLVDKTDYFEPGSDVRFGSLKTEMSKAGLYNMKVAGAELDWHEQIASVEEYVVENDGFSGINFDDEGHDVDGVTAATIHFSEFKDAFESAVPADEAVYTYAAEGPVADNGWQSFIVYQMKGDDVISATMDAFLVDPSGYLEDGVEVEVGALKSDLSKEGIYNMKVAGAKADWHEQIVGVEEYLVENDSFADLKMDDEGYDVDGVTGATIHINGFTDLFNM